MTNTNGNILNASMRMVRWTIVSAMSFVLGTAIAAPLPLTWNGGESGNLSDESWDGGEEGHLSPQDGDTLVFGTGGTFTSDIAGLQVAALTFSSSSAVTLSGSEKITVLCGGSVRSTGSGTVTISAPIQAGESAGSAVTFADVGSSSNPLKITGVISGEAPVTVGAANGTVEFSGNNTFTGKLTVNNGFFNATGKNALGLGTTEASFSTGNGNGRAKITLNGVNATMPIRNAPGNVSGEVTFAYTANKPTVFLQPFTITGSSSWLVNNWATVVFSNRLSTAYYFQGNVNTGGKIELWGEGSSINHYSLNLYGSTSANGYGTLVVGSPVSLSDWSSTYGIFFKQSYGIIRTMVDDAFPNADVDVGWNPLRFTSSVAGATFDMNGHGQTFICILDDAKRSSNVIKSSKSCTLRLKQDWSEKRNLESLSVQAFGGAIQGKVSLSVEGPDPLVLSGPSTSTGGIALTNGATVVFSETGTWGGTDFFVAGGSALAISNAAVVAAGSAIEIVDESAEARSKLVLGDVVLNAADIAVTINGRRLKGGVWGSSESGAANVDDEHFAGPGTILAAASSSGTEEATWDAGGGADERVSKSANWDGDILPDFGAGSLVATFASSGTNAIVDANVDFKGLVFSGASNFALSGNGSASATLGAEGISASFAHVAAIDVPLQLTAAQTWNVAEGGTVSVKKPVSSDAPWSLTKTGAGKLELRAPSSFSGDFTVNNGAVDVYAATNAFGSGVGAVTFVERTESRTTLSKLSFKADSTVDNPFTYKFFAGIGDGFVVDAGKKVCFTQPVTFASARESSASWCDGTVVLQEGSQMVFSNGLSTVYLVVGSATGSLESRFAVRDKPMTTQNQFILKNTTVLELGATGNVFRSAITLNGWKTGLDFGADWAISNEVCSVYTGNGVSWKNAIKLNGHSQQVGTFYTRSGDSGTIESPTPAMWNFKAPVDGTTNATVKFTGRAGLGLYGGGTYAINCAMTSKGAVDVSGGTLEFLPSGSWAGCSNLTVRGTGTLKIAAAGTFSTNTNVRVSSGSGAKIVVADGVVQKVGYMHLDGNELSRGLYGGANAPVPMANRLSCFDSSSTGVFKVTRGKSGGTVIIVL